MRTITEEEAKLEDIRRRLSMISLMGVLLTNAVFLAVWFLFMPELPLYIPVLFVALSVGIWYVIVKSKINDLGRKKKGAAETKGAEEKKGAKKKKNKTLNKQN